MEIIDILNEFQWDYRPTSGGYYTHCPVCHNGKKRYTAKVFTDSNVLTCARCGRSFGWAKTHYALRYGTDLPDNEIKDYAKELYQRDHIPTEIKSGVISKPMKKETALADSKRRDSVYRAFLSSLSLREEDRNELLRRGMTEDEIEKRMYKSIPSPEDKRKALEILTKSFDTLEGIPGFFRNERDEWECLFHSNQGFLIPVVSFRDEIEQVLYRTNLKSKYLYFSSNGKRSGSGAKTLIHVSGDLESCNEIIITEGILKSDVIQSILDSSFDHRGKFCTVGVPGVNSIKTLEPIIPYMKGKLVHIAYDMDSLGNIHVSRAEEKLFSLLDQNHVRFDRMYWDQNFKGLDDYLDARLSRDWIFN